MIQYKPLGFVTCHFQGTSSSNSTWRTGYELVGTGCQLDPTCAVLTQWNQAVPYSVTLLENDNTRFAVRGMLMCLPVSAVFPKRARGADRHELLAGMGRDLDRIARTSTYRIYTY